MRLCPFRQRFKKAGAPMQDKNSGILFILCGDIFLGHQAEVRTACLSTVSEK